MKTALLVGATGLVGGLVLEQLLADTYFEKVIVLTRKSLGKSNSKLKEVLVDFNKLDDYTAEIKADAVFCCLGTTIKVAGSKEAFKKVDFEYPFKVAQLAKQNGTSTYLLITALGASKNSMIFYNQVKGELEEEVSKLNFGAFHILQPSLIIGERAESRTGEGIAQKLAPVFDALMIGGLKKYKSITATQIAKAMVYYSKLNDKGIFKHESDELQQV
ncbi:MAG TPA: NAD(P)H-binding protein [Chitinophagales bacterium]|nr:NAD(P)H-binding protein [Chitinophagales bacterium]